MSGKIILLSLFVSLAQANTDPAARNLLIDKFEKVYIQLAPGDEARTGVSLRLADLLSERARFAAMEDLGAGCVDCNAGKKDRLRALKYYKEVLPNLKTSQKAKVLAQMGHLYQMSGQESEAIALYQEILSSSNEADKAEANLSLGEIFFKRRDFSRAASYYNEVLASNTKTRKSLAAYRRAWCQFNLGQVDQAIASLLQILNTNELLNRDPSGFSGVDMAYKAEITKDLATFYAKSNVGLAEAKLLYQYSPENVKLENVSYLATELERLGQIAAALQVFRFAIEKESDPAKRLEYFIRTSQLEKDQNKIDESLNDYKKSLSLWTQLDGCEGKSCEELQLRLRKYVLDWHKAEEKRPSEKVLEAYHAYLEVFSNEVDMQIWFAKAYEQLERYEEAMNHYDAAADLVMSGAAVVGKNNKEKIPSHESLLLAQIEVAEKSKQKNLLNIAYSKYVATSKEKTKLVDVKYQQAHLLYKAGQYEQAASAFKEVALLDIENNETKRKAADLALDSLALLKDDMRIQAWAADFASVFKGASQDYRNVASKAMLNRSAKLAENQNDLEASWEVLNKIDTQSLSEADRLSYYKNRLVLAEKLKNLQEVKLSADKILEQEKASKEDRSLALSRRAWVAEMELDFVTAYDLTEKLELADISEDQRLIKLALLAELAGKDWQKYYASFIQKFPKDERSVAMAERLVEEGEQPLRALKQYKNILMAKPSHYAFLFLQADIKETKNIERSKKELLSNKELAKTPSAIFVWRSQFLTQLESLNQHLHNHVIDASSQAKLNQSLTKRLSLINSLQKLSEDAIKQQDWTAQVLALDLLRRESSRVYQDILALPMPDGLSDQEQMQYMNLLSQQAAPHQIRADELNKKLNEFWQNSNIVTTYQKTYETTIPDLQSFVAKEISLLTRVAPEQVKEGLANVVKVEKPKSNLPSLADLENLRTQIRMDPLNTALLERLLEQEKRLGQTAMVNYLENRIALGRKQ